MADLASMNISFGADISGLERGTKKAQKELVNVAVAANKVDSSLAKGTGVAKSSRNFMDLSRVLQDLPFGFQGVQNNLTQLIPGVGAAGLAFSALISAVTFAQVGLSYWSRGAKDASDGSEQLRSSADALGAAFKNSDFSNAVKNVNELKINIQLAKEGVLDKTKVLHQYNDTLGKTTGEVKSLEEAEMALQKNAKAYVQMTLYKTAAQLALKDAAQKALDVQKQAAEDEAKAAKAVQLGARNSDGTLISSKEFERREKLIEEGSKKRQETILKAGQKEVDAMTNVANDLQARAAKIAKDNKFDFFGGTETDKVVKPKTDKIAEILRDLATSFDIINHKAETFGATLGQVNGDRIKATEKAIESMLGIRTDASSKQVARLTGQLNELLRVQDRMSVPTQTIKVDKKFETDLFGKAAIGLSPLVLPDIKIMPSNKIWKDLSEFNKKVGDILKEGLSSSVAGFAQSLGDVISGQGSIRDVFEGLFTTIGSYIQQLGMYMIGISPLVTSIKTALKSLNPTGMLLAGAGLVALGQVMKNIPKFAGGVENFSGGLAYVHQGEVLVNMPKGSSVIPKKNVSLNGGMSQAMQVFGEFELRNDRLVAAVKRGEARNNRNG